MKKKKNPNECIEIAQELLHCCAALLFARSLLSEDSSDLAGRHFDAVRRAMNERKSIADIRLGRVQLS